MEEIQSQIPQTLVRMLFVVSIYTTHSKSDAHTTTTTFLRTITSPTNQNIPTNILRAAVASPSLSTGLASTQRFSRRRRGHGQDDIVNMMLRTAVAPSAILIAAYVLAMCAASSYEVSLSDRRPTECRWRINYFCFFRYMISTSAVSSAGFMVESDIYSICIKIITLRSE